MHLGGKIHFNGNLRDKDNLPTKDSGSAPNVSVVQRFHCTLLVWSIVLVYYT